MTPRLDDGERLLHYGVANMQRGWEAVGGRVFLTNRKLEFQSHSFNVQSGTSEIPVREVAGVQTGWTKFLGVLPLMPNSIIVQHRDGTAARFVVFGRNKWVAAIRQAIA